MQAYAAHLVMISSRRGILLWKGRWRERTVVYGQPVNKGECHICPEYEIVAWILSVDNEVDSTQQIRNKIGSFSEIWHIMQIRDQLF